MFNQYYIYQSKLQQKAHERDQLVMSELKEKPTICKKSSIIATRASSLNNTPDTFRQQLKRHEHCYFGGRGGGHNDDHSHDHSRGFDYNNP
jgi:hypothetical protein